MHYIESHDKNNLLLLHQYHLLYPVRLYNHMRDKNLKEAHRSPHTNYKTSPVFVVECHV